MNWNYGIGAVPQNADRRRIELALNNTARQGWELVQAYYNSSTAEIWHYFRRPATEGERGEFSFGLD
jgi:hypothetical protein